VTGYVLLAATADEIRCGFDAVVAGQRRVRVRADEPQREIDPLARLLAQRDAIASGVRKNAWLEPWTWKRTRGSVWPRFSKNVSGRLRAGLATAPCSSCGGALPPQATAKLASAKTDATDRTLRSIPCDLLSSCP
jgi:hypothetical protein